MAGELTLIINNSLDERELGCLEKNIDKLIKENINNSTTVNQLAFLCSGVLASGDDFEEIVSGKLRQSMLWGNLYGSNRELGDKLILYRDSAKYAAQMILEKLAEKKMMGFDVITAINNRLNASVNKMDVEFKNVYDGMNTFFKHNKSELARMEMRLEKAERNIKMLHWQSTIKYQEFEGTDYLDLEPEAKIVCLVRDFYEITKGKWTTSDLLLFETAMGTLDLSHRDRFNFYEAIHSIATQSNLKNKLLGGKKLAPIVQPDMLLSMTGFKKLESYAEEDRYMVESVGEILDDQGISMDEESITNQLVLKYFRKEVRVNMDIKVAAYDFCLDLLYNLKQAEAMGILVGEKQDYDTPELPYSERDEEEEPVPEIPVESEEIEAQEKPAADLVAKGDEYYEGKVRNQDYHQAWALYEKASQQGNIDAFKKMAYMCKHGIGRKMARAQARHNYLKAGEMGDSASYVEVARMYLEDGDRDLALRYLWKAADLGNIEACYEIVDYATGVKMVGNRRWLDLPQAQKALERAAQLGDNNAYTRLGNLFENDNYLVKAMNYYKTGMQLGNGNCAYELGRIYYENKKFLDYDKAFEYFEKAEAMGCQLEALMMSLGNMYEKGQSVYINKVKAREYYEKALDCIWNFETVMMLATREDIDIAKVCNALTYLANKNIGNAKVIVESNWYKDANTNALRYDFVKRVARIATTGLKDGATISSQKITSAVQAYQQHPGLMMAGIFGGVLAARRR